MTVVNKTSEMCCTLNRVIIYISAQVLVYKDNIVKGKARSRITNVLRILLLSLLTVFQPFGSHTIPPHYEHRGSQFLH
jgi:hypothetical protein